MPRHIQKRGKLKIRRKVQKGGKFKLGAKAKLGIGIGLTGLGAASFLGLPNLGSVGVIEGGSKLISDPRKKLRKKKRKRKTKRKAKRLEAEQQVELLTGGGLQTRGFLTQSKFKRKVKRKVKRKIKKGSGIVSGGRIQGKKIMRGQIHIGRDLRPTHNPNNINFNAFPRLMSTSSLPSRSVIMTNRPIGGGLGKTFKQVKRGGEKFFSGKASVKPSQILLGIAGVSTVASLNPLFAPVTVPLGTISLGASRLSAAFGAGGRQFAKKRKRGRPRKSLISARVRKKK